MSAHDPGLSHHPAPKRGRTSGGELAFVLFAGPLAWFVQLNTGYGLMGTVCYPGPDRNIALPPGTQWTWVLTAVLYLVCLAVALLSGLAALRLLRRTRDEDVGSSAPLEETGRGRTRFLAYWGVILGFGFAFVVLVNGLALLMVDPCAQ